jgi:hypothetical protein
MFFAFVLLIICALFSLFGWPFVAVGAVLCVLFLHD